MMDCSFHCNHNGCREHYDEILKLEKVANKMSKYILSAIINADSQEDWCVSANVLP